MLGHETVDVISVLGDLVGQADQVLIGQGVLEPFLFLDLFLEEFPERELSRRPDLLGQFKAGGWSISRLRRLSS
jgi:hypothetical protein